MRMPSEAASDRMDWKYAAPKVPEAPPCVFDFRYGLLAASVFCEAGKMPPKAGSAAEAVDSSWLPTYEKAAAACAYAARSRVVAM